jgi:hypothetical protein
MPDGQSQPGIGTMNDVTAERAERIIEAVERTEALDNVHELTGLLG